MPHKFGVPQGSVLGPFLLTQYTVAIEKICRRHGAYITFKVNSITDYQTAITISHRRDMHLDDPAQTHDE